MNNETEKTIIDLERAALDRWAKGDPSGCLEISSHDVTYFDPFLPKRINGIEELARYYEGLRGKIKVDNYDLINPEVKVIGEVAILTFNYISFTGTDQSDWNCSEVYRKTDGAWKIIQTHWSLTQPKLKS